MNTSSYKIDNNGLHQELRLSMRRLRHLIRGSMFIDICLATAWAAMIPGLMWLGVAGGF